MAQDTNQLTVEPQARHLENSGMVEPQNTMGITVHAAAAFGDENCFKKGTVQKKKKKKSAVVGLPNISSPDTVCPDEGTKLTT